MSNRRELFSIKMRASQQGAHLSGAERIVAENRVAATAGELVSRAMAHPKGQPDFVNVKIESAGQPQTLQALPVTTREANTPEAGWAMVKQLLEEVGVQRAEEIIGMFNLTYPMRGAMLLDADTLERLEPDQERGVRATYMDAIESIAPHTTPRKNHFAEALVLATKVVNAPGIVGEICVSDDPDYTTGYVATKESGYVRITPLKRSGEQIGGRIFLYRGPKERIAETLDFLQCRRVLVCGVPPNPPQQTEQVHADPLAQLSEELDEIRRSGLWRSVRVNPPRLLSFADNDYLGLAGDPRLKAAAMAAVSEFGVGAGASRLVTGTKPPHLRLERHLASFKGTEDAVVWATGYMANVGTITSLVGKGDAVFSDELNHASIVDGCRLSRAEVFIYRHNDMDDLAAKIAQAGPRRRRLAVTDAVFSMDGDWVNLPEFLELCRANGVISMIDEAHSTGVMGATGRGLCEHFGCGHPDILMGTLSKALGCEGGYVCATRQVSDYLKNRSRTFIFSTAPCPAVAAAADCALTVLEETPGLAATVRQKAAAFAALLSERGINAPSGSAIIPVMVGGEKRAIAVAQALEQRGFLVPAIRYPTVARGQARLRVAVSARMETKDLEALADAIAEVLRETVQD